MLQEIETKTITETADQTLTLSAAASDAVKNILEERKLEGYALRVYVAGGGCCGVNFGMALDNNFRDVDTTYDLNGVKVVVDEVSIDYLRGASIDYVNDPVRGAGFAVDSPNAKGGECSCGSGSHAHADSGSCGCGGGSCACQN
ncbi:MAG TPA: iron-sulfur cluster assembly accessory protein [Anaerolineales bacterium]|nr:iron-sulfur cluster assembly accessory protein [Anaerolineales bacterium]